MLECRPHLTAQDFIYRVATEPEFREKHLANPNLLADEYDVDPIDLESIKKIDAAKLEKELTGIRKFTSGKIGGSFSYLHNQDSYTDHSKDIHENHSHEKSSNEGGEVSLSVEEMLAKVIEQNVLPEALIKIKKLPS